MLASGALRYGAITGSIRQVGSTLRNTPCNGWEQWYYLDEGTGQRLPLDTLREKYLAEATQSGEDHGEGG